MASPFWTFSLAFYRQPDVAEACLSCQDEAGADVNLILFMLWQAGRGIRLDTSDVAAIDARVAPWRTQVVEPLRTIRRLLKVSPLLAGGEDYRERIKRLELEAERLLQEALFAEPPAGSLMGDIPAAARNNIDAYQAASGLTLPAASVATLLARLATMPRSVSTV